MKRILTALLSAFAALAVSAFTNDDFTFVNTPFGTGSEAVTCGDISEDVPFPLTRENYCAIAKLLEDACRVSMFNCPEFNTWGVYKDEPVAGVLSPSRRDITIDERWRLLEKDVFKNIFSYALNQMESGVSVTSNGVTRFPMSSWSLATSGPSSSGWTTSRNVSLDELFPNICAEAGNLDVDGYHSGTYTPTIATALSNMLAAAKFNVSANFETMTESARDNWWDNLEEDFPGIRTNNALRCNWERDEHVPRAYHPASVRAMLDDMRIGWFSWGAPGTWAIFTNRTDTKVKTCTIASERIKTLVRQLVPQGSGSYGYLSYVVTETNGTNFVSATYPSWEVSAQVTESACTCTNIYARYTVSNDSTSGSWDLVSETTTSLGTVRKYRRAFDTSVAFTFKDVVIGGCGSAETKVVSQFCRTISVSCNPAREGFAYMRRCVSKIPDDLSGASPEIKYFVSGHRTDTEPDAYGQNTTTEYSLLYGTPLPHNDFVSMFYCIFDTYYAFCNEQMPSTYDLRPDSCCVTVTFSDPSDFQFISERWRVVFTPNEDAVAAGYEEEDKEFEPRPDNGSNDYVIGGPDTDEDGTVNDSRYEEASGDPTVRVPVSVAISGAMLTAPQPRTKIASVPLVMGYEAFDWN